uniref:Heparan-alpha-glucosaminide N-acetyltransferase catalytic domain-containing protein n=1 Tax=Populus alba TaxID=43335 RepID=A0A4V6ABG4_POPAL|nr:hypothetical protein D5086_0000054990 [Populus alba]
MKLIRWFGILQRIALVYMVVALIEALIPKNRQTKEPGHFTIFTAYRWQWIAGFISFVVYMVTTFALYVPDWSFTVDQDHERRRYTIECGMRGHLGPACNGVGYVDREVWGINHLYQYPVWSRLKLYSFSYVCFTAGAAGIVFSGFYVLIDVWGLRPPFLFLEWIGMNAMLVYVMAAQGIFEGFINGWYYKSPDSTLLFRASCTNWAYTGSSEKPNLLLEIGSFIQFLPNPNGAGSLSIGWKLQHCELRSNLAKHSNCQTEHACCFCQFRLPVPDLLVHHSTKGRSSCTFKMVTGHFTTDSLKLQCSSISFPSTLLPDFAQLNPLQSSKFLASFYKGYRIFPSIKTVYLTDSLAIAIYLISEIKLIVRG